MQIEIGQYRTMDKGALKGYFTMIIHPECLMILDCKHFEKDGQTWFAFPSKVVKKEDKIDYYPYISFLNKDHQKQFTDSFIEAIKKFKKGSNETSNTSKTAKSTLPPQPSVDWDDLPF